MEPIAVVGMGCLFPGADSPQAYFDNLLASKDVASPLTEDLLGGPVSRYFDSRMGKEDKICYHTNGYIRDYSFDPTGYKVEADKLAGLDELFKWTLHAAKQALDDAGQCDEIKRRCGVVLGNIGMPNHTGKRMLNGFYSDILEPYVRKLLGTDTFTFHREGDVSSGDKDNLSVASLNAIIASDSLGLQGPSYTLDAACASALYSIKVASDYLNTGKVDMMLAGAVCHADRIYIAHGFNILQAFPDVHEQSIPFDSNSQGLKAGEGAGVVALKRLSDAQANGDRIYGVIESIGLSNDGGAKHILVPDSGGQLKALQRAYDNVEEQTEYLECHATGTPVGDQVELNTIESFFSERGYMPFLGANKGNIGHMLTASGMASIFKILLSLDRNIIPATIQLNEMVKTKQGRLTIDNVVRQNKAWPKTDAPRRAGVNAFGFGGVNGHMIITEPKQQDSNVVAQKRPAHSSATSLAITGMAVAMAEAHTPEQFNEAIYQARQAFTSLPKTRWSGVEKNQSLLAQYGLAEPPKGAYIEKFEFDCRRFKLPPNVAGIHLLSHMSLMQLAATAFYDAGFKVQESRQNIAVIVAADNDFLCYRYQARNEAAWHVKDSLQRSGIALSDEQVSQLETIVKDSLFPAPYAEGITGGINNVVASRISANLKLNGPAFTVSAQENSVFRAVELAHFLLTLDDIDAVMVGSGSFCGGLEDVLINQSHTPADMQATGFSYDAKASGYNVGEGGGVIVLRTLESVQRDKQDAYAVIDGLTLQHCHPEQVHSDPSERAQAQASINSLFQQVGCNPSDIGLLELNAAGVSSLDSQELPLMSEVYGSSSNRPPATGSVKSIFGHLQAASGMASMIKTALCLNQSFLPATPNWSGFKDGYKAYANHFNVLEKSQAWASKQGATRRAAISSLSRDNSLGHMLMSSVPPDVNNKELTEIDMEALLKGALMKTIHIGRESTIEDMVVSEENRAHLGIKSVPEAISCAVESSSEHVQSAAEQVVVSLEAYKARERERAQQIHLAYLKTENLFYRSLQSIAQVGMGAGGSSEAVSAASQQPKGTTNQASLKPVSKSRTSVIFDYGDLLEMTNGSVAKVLGDWYQEVDQYPVRTRMPSPPYMFVSRITKITAVKEKLEPCVIEWEYDLHSDEWFTYHQLVPAFVSLESSHAMIVAFTLIGCDKLFKGELKYRAIDSTTTIHSVMPKAGEILRGRVSIEGFTKVGKNILIRYVFDGYVENRHCFTLTATSGFFPQEEIAKSKGLSTTKLFAKASVQTPFSPFLHCDKTQFSDEDLKAVQKGNLASCFGPDWGNTAAPGLYAEKAKMLDRIIQVLPKGGAWGLGQMIGEVDVKKSHWAFQAHFKNDPVLPGTLIVEGAEQLVRFYLYYIGLHTQTQLQPELLNNHSYSAKFRGEVLYADEKLQYRMTVKSISIEYEDQTQNVSDFQILFIVETLYRDRVIGVSDNLGARFSRSVSMHSKELIQ